MKTLILLAMAAILGASVPAWAQDDQSKAQSDQNKAEGDQSKAQGDQTKPLRLRVSAGVAEGLKVHDVQPKYPQEARKKQIQGDVILLATIDKKGKISRLMVSQGDPILAKAAVDAVKHWRYKPYLLKGEPVEVETKVEIMFRF